MRDSGLHVTCDERSACSLRLPYCRIAVKRMLKSACRPGRFLAASRRLLSTSSSASSQGPNAPLDLDPSFQDLLKDAEMSLLKFKPTDGGAVNTNAMKELEVLGSSSIDPPSLTDIDELDVRSDRKSARARFGTNKIGSVVLPPELQSAIQRVIDGKKRIFIDSK